MRDDLFPYYENELSFIRNMGKEFAAQWGKIAERLALEPGKCEDPHVERLIEAFALLAGRIHHKIDDEFPEVTESLLNVLYPHYLRPIPSMSIAQFRMDAQQDTPTTGHTIKQNTSLYATAIAGKPTTCTFRTCYPVSLWPLEVTYAAVMPAAALGGSLAREQEFAVIRIDLSCTGGTKLSTLGLEKLRFYLDGENVVAHALYELLFSEVSRVVFRSAAKPSISVESPAQVIQPVGFGSGEGILTYPENSFLGYRLIQEYFSFPWKYLFFDLTGLERVVESQVGENFQVLIFLRSFERRERMQVLVQNVGRETFQLGCTPIVNLFQRLAEPIRLTHAKAEYRIIPDVNRQASTEIYSVDQVTSTAPYFESALVYKPFYSLRHCYGDSPAQPYWYASRRLSERQGDSGTEVYLSLVDPAFKPSLPPVETLTLHVTCTNRDLAGQLPFTLRFGELFVESGSLAQVRCVIAPTKTIRPPLRRGLQWRLISHLALNYLSIVDGGTSALQEILRLYDFTENAAILRQISAIVGLSSEPQLRRIVSEHGIVFAQGLRVKMELDEDGFSGAGVFLFAAVLERFLALYTAINSFTQLEVTTRQRRGVLKPWPPRSGEQILL